MDAYAQLETLVELARRIGIRVRREPAAGSGGLCVLHGTRLLVIDSEADVATKVETCLRAMAQLPEVEELYVVPELRERIERWRTPS